MRLLLFLLYYALAVLLGFMLRGRFDAWVYRRRHMQQRLVVWAADVVTYVERGGDDVLLPPSTLDAEAWSPRAARAAGASAARFPEDAAGGAAPSPSDPSSASSVSSPAPAAPPVEPS